MRDAHSGTGNVPQMAPAQTPPPLILASTSRYRRELLERLQMPFEVEAPGVDETPLPGEAPAALAQRLALQKAHAVAQRHPSAVVIGSDQVADLNGQAIGKPHTHERAVQQLRAMSGHSVVFQTAVAVVRHHAGMAEVRLSPVVVRFRDLSDVEIETYLRREQPYDCAGSAKSEGLGITLLRNVESLDPTALIGLPLTTVCELMRLAGLDPLTAGATGGVSANTSPPMAGHGA
jgi:septum formation protein